MTGMTDRFDVSMIGTAATTDNVDLRQQAEQLAVFAAKLGRITIIELDGFIEFGVAAPRRVGAQPPDA